MNKTKIIVLTGGVFSSLGKGLIIGSIGRILRTQGFRVSALKLDPYLNLDSGTMSPYQHGEIFVTYDGGETDLDLGHYERFLDYPISKFSSLSAGRIYDQVLKKERDGEYLGKTVQIVPHVINEVHEHIHKILANDPKLDFLLIEVGGTVGDIESLPFIESLRSFKLQDVTNKICYIHVAPLITLKISSEIKTKPTQHSVQKLRGYGIVPNFLILRTENNVDHYIKEKIALHCDLPADNIFFSNDVRNIYLLPELLYNQNLHQKLFEYFKIDDFRTNNLLTDWTNFTAKIKAVKKTSCRLAIVGKYVGLPDAYLSIIESFKLASYQLAVDLTIDLIYAEDFNHKQKLWTKLQDYDAVCVPYGFGARGIEGKISAIEFCRVNKVPFLGICLGMQLAVIEYARNCLAMADANSQEFDQHTPSPLFLIQKDKLVDHDLGGTLFLGNTKIFIKPDTLISRLYQTDVVYERYRHRYDFNNNYLKDFMGSDLVFAATTANDVQAAIELKNHPFFVGCQYHPEFGSKPLKVNALFVGLLSTVINKNNN